MGIAKAQFNDVLATIFDAGNTIRLYTKTPTEGVETDGTLLTGTGVMPYEIKSGDFSISQGQVTSARNIMLYLYEGSPVTCDGFGVFKGNTTTNLLYFGKFTKEGVDTPIDLNFNDVPAIKKYNSTNGEGIKITITSTEASASTV